MDRFGSIPPASDRERRHDAFKIAEAQRRVVEQDPTGVEYAQDGIEQAPIDKSAGEAVPIDKSGGEIDPVD